MNAANKLLLLAATLALGAAGPAGCNLILGTGYVVGGEDGSAPGQDAASPDGPAGDDAPAGDGPTVDAPVDTCGTNPQTKSQLESACTGASCQPFDNASRNTKCRDGGTVCPAVAPFDAGTPETSASEAGVPDAGGSDGGPPDGGSTV